MPAAGDKGVWIAYLSGEIDFYDKQTKKIISYNSRNIPGLTGRNRCCRDDKNGALYVGHIGNGMTIINLKEKTAKNIFMNQMILKVFPEIMYAPSS